MDKCKTGPQKKRRNHLWDMNESWTVLRSYGFTQCAVLSQKPNWYDRFWQKNIQKSILTILTSTLLSKNSKLRKLKFNSGWLPISITYFNKMYFDYKSMKHTNCASLKIEEMKPGSWINISIEILIQKRFVLKVQIFWEGQKSLAHFPLILK